jgi:transposase
MIAFPAGRKVWIAGGVTDMRRGMNTLALPVQQGLGRDPHAGEIFCFRGCRGDLVKLLWHDGVGMSLYLIQTVREKFICRACEKISRPPAPFHAIPRGWAGPQLIAMIAFEKYGRHQPLNRQSERIAREGIICLG